jgi:hypothetical protein
MWYLSFILLTLSLTVGLVALIQYEARHGVRFFRKQRLALDLLVDRTEFILTHVDLAAFLRDEIRYIANKVGHETVALSLRGVRLVERQLTRLVRYLRLRSENTELPPETNREFVKTLSEFKEQLKATTPEVPEIQ